MYKIAGKMLRSVVFSRQLLHFTAVFRHQYQVPCAGFKSVYSIDKIYPESNQDYASNPTFSPKDRDNANQEFSGYIPVDELDISYTKSGGPGGQNVNKVATKVQVRFSVANASWIPEWIKPKLMEKESSRINKDGVFIIGSDKTRKQLLNQADCMDKIRDAIRKASIRPIEPTEEEVELKNKRLAKAKREALRQKRAHSLKKQSRQAPGVGGL